MAGDMDRLLADLNPNAPASLAAVEAIERQLGIKLPPEYVEFLNRTNGGEGFVGKNAYVMLWAVGELASMNEAYEVQKYVPGLLIFGSDGGGEAFGFDTRIPECPIVQVPFVGMAWDLAPPMGTTFDRFLERLHETEDEDLSRQREFRGKDCRGKEIFETTPFILGGGPTDPANKTVLTRVDHIKAVVYWNKVIKELREQRKSR